MRNIFLFISIISLNLPLQAQVEENSYEVENLGSNVNHSEYEEIAPYITPDGKKLFFVLCGHPDNTFYSSDSEAQSI